MVRLRGAELRSSTLHLSGEYHQHLGFPPGFMLPKIMLYSKHKREDTKIYETASIGESHN